MVSTSAPDPRPSWHKAFMAMLSQIFTHAKIAFRHIRGQDRQDLIQETIANALVAFVAPARRGKLDLAFPSVLARYAVAQIKDGHRVGNSLNVREVLSPYAQRNKGFHVERLDHYDDEDQAWN